MAIRFMHCGKEYIADTPEEAVRLRYMLEDSDFERSERDPDFRDRLAQQVSGWTEETFWELMNSLGEQQVKLITAIYLWTTIDDVDLMAALNLSSKEALAGVVSGLSKQLDKANVKPSDVFYVRDYWEGRKKQRNFRLSQGFEGAAAMSTWSWYWKLDQWATETEARLDRIRKHEKRSRKGTGGAKHEIEDTGATKGTKNVKSGQR